MSAIIISLVASNLVWDGSGTVSHFSIIAVSLVFGIPILGGICWQIVESLIERFHGRNWPTISAVINITSVAYIPDNVGGFKGPKTPSYRAMLTYTYNSPEQQMGDYSRDFGNEDDARAWANSYKGKTIKIHVDPRDPTRSVLRKEDL